jgi:protein-L-isoaspartate(D-aspartate) O-methyltransferase
MKKKREQMVEEILAKYGDISTSVASALLQVPRDEFAPKEFKDIAYADGPVPIGFKQTMSQPYTVAFMTDLLELTGKEKVLEIGTGSGYQAAVLSKLAKAVFTIEIVPGLAKNAKVNLERLGFNNVFVKCGSGEYGWPKHAPYDAVVVTAGIRGGVPVTLFEQLKYNGLLVAPVGRGYNKVMTRYKKTRRGKKSILDKEEYGVFRFVPFIEGKGEY